MFPGPGWFGHFHKGARNFLDVLKSGDPACVLRLLRSLEGKFNGNVFSLPSESTLTAQSLKQFANLVEARTLKEQRYLWDQFSFSHVPVEVISHLYQRFVTDSTAVYTPPFLAALLLDFAMPYNQLSGKERVLDPACGSGVFLVGAMRRLVNVWRSKNKWASPTVETLKSILREQIFGVEKDPVAVDLTAFSPALAVCDSLRPDVIWNELRFDRLRNQNVFEDDFFNFSTVGDEEGLPSLGRFDVVIGNPPFESAFSAPAIRVNKCYENDRGSIPDKQIAYLFLDQALRTTRENGIVCLIQSSGFLYNVQSHLFRASLARTGRISAILDFTSIRGLYGRSGADPKTLAVLVGSKAPKILHLTFRRTYETTQRVAFEIDHYDRHQLDPNEVAENVKAARPNLLGGGRLGSISSRLQEMRTLREVVDENSWLMGEGYIEGKYNKQPGPHLSGHPHLPTVALKSDGIDEEKIVAVEATAFQWPRNPILFQPPLILIREHESLPMAFWDRSTLTFKDKIVGIHASVEKKRGLIRLFKFMQSNRDRLRFAATLNGSQSLVGKATALLKNDIESLPIPRDPADLDLTFWEQALADDTLDYMAAYVRLGQNSPLLRESASVEAVEAYAKLYCRMLGSIYNTPHPQIGLKRSTAG